VEFGYGIFVGVSHDVGATWARSKIGDGDAFGLACCDPTITWDVSGNLFLGWVGYAGRQVPTVLTIVTSIDGGDTWSSFEDLTPRAPRARVHDGLTLRAREQERGGAIDQPTITSGHRMLWAIWSQSGTLQAAGARIRGLGDAGPFRAVHDVPHSTNCTFGDIAIGPAGQVMQVCQKNVPKIRPRRSVLRTNVDRDGLGPGTFGAGKVVARTRVSLFESIPAQRQRTVDAEAGLAWDTTAGTYADRLYLIYTNEYPDQSNDTDVLVMTSTTSARPGAPPSGSSASPTASSCRRSRSTPPRGTSRSGSTTRASTPDRGPTTPTARTTPTRCTRSRSARTAAPPGRPRRW
jgi:hypothetical protein